MVFTLFVHNKKKCFASYGLWGKALKAIYEHWVSREPSEIPVRNCLVVEMNEAMCHKFKALIHHHTSCLAEEAQTQKPFWCMVSPSHVSCYDKGLLRWRPVADKARAAFLPCISCLLQPGGLAAFFPVKGIPWESSSLPPAGQALFLGRSQGFTLSGKIPVPCSLMNSSAACNVHPRAAARGKAGGLLCTILVTYNSAVTP